MYSFQRDYRNDDNINSGYAMIVEKHFNKYERMLDENERKFNRYKSNDEVITITDNNDKNIRKRNSDDIENEEPNQTEKKQKTISNNTVNTNPYKISGDRWKYVYTCQWLACLYETSSYSALIKHLRDCHHQKMSGREKKRFRDSAMMRYNAITELPERYRLPEFFTATHSRLTPYFAQIGDEVVYSKRGHQHYIDTVKDNRIYKINANVKPHKSRNRFSDEIFARIVDIKYIVKPPRIVKLRLNIIDTDTGEQTNSHFSVCYRYIKSFVDFIILRHLYDKSFACEWKVGNDFRAIHDSIWRFGTITGVVESSPFSHFQCFDVVWANGETGLLSGWHLQRTCEQTVPQRRIASVSVTRDQVNAYNVWHEHEWPDCGKVDECRRISQGLKTIMELSVAQDFAVAVDLNAHPVYGMTIAYPIDLSTIKSRVDNHYYRCVDAIKFDIRFIESNAREFCDVKAHSEIVDNAKIVCDLCARFIEDKHCYDPLPIYLDIMA